MRTLKTRGYKDPKTYHFLDSFSDHSLQVVLRLVFRSDLWEWSVCDMISYDTWYVVFSLVLFTPGQSGNNPYSSAPVDFTPATDVTLRS